MNWDAIAAIAEVVGVVGIIVTIGYLGVQLRHSNQTAEDSAFKSTLALGFSSDHEMTEGENADVMIKGLLKYDDLRGREKLIFDNLITMWISSVEAALLSRELEFVDEGTTTTLGYMLRTRFFPYDGVRSWWSEAKGIYSPEVQQWFEQEMSKADRDSDFYGIRSGG